MIRFRVVKGSHLLLVISLLILLTVIAFIALQGGFAPQMQTDNRAIRVEQTAPTEARAIAAFASDSASPARLQIDILPDPTAAASHAPEQNPILIYHTHTHEAYEPEAGESYAALEAWRTDDTEHNVVQLGRALAQALREKGYTVIHDTTDHEQDSLDNSYVRSLETLESYSEHFLLCIDLHRDAYVEGMRPCIEHNGERYAQLMCLVGRGDLYPAEEKPDYEKNLQFAQNITIRLNNVIPDICRNVTIKKGRYNQHIGEYNLLIEVGHQKNSLQQALNSIPVLANGIDFALTRP